MYNKSIGIISKKLVISQTNIRTNLLRPVLISPLPVLPEDNASIVNQGVILNIVLTVFLLVNIFVLFHILF